MPEAPQEPLEESREKQATHPATKNALSNGHSRRNMHYSGATRFETLMHSNIFRRHESTANTQKSCRLLADHC